jgi:hypothetical protein
MLFLILLYLIAKKVKLSSRKKRNLHFHQNKKKVNPFFRWKIEENCENEKARQKRMKIETFDLTLNERRASISTVVLVSISPTFYVQKFNAKLFCTYILGLIFFRRKNIGANTHIKCWWIWPPSCHLFFFWGKNMKTTTNTDLSKIKMSEGRKNICLRLPLSLWGRQLMTSRILKISLSFQTIYK